MASTRPPASAVAASGVWVRGWTRARAAGSWPCFATPKMRRASTTICTSTPLATARVPTRAKAVAPMPWNRPSREVESRPLATVATETAR